MFFVRFISKIIKTNFYLFGIKFTKIVILVTKHKILIFGSYKFDAFVFMNIIFSSISTIITDYYNLKIIVTFLVERKSNRHFHFFLFPLETEG